MIGPPGDSLIRMGAKYGPLIRYNYEFWRLISPIFLHSGLIQIIINLFFQLRMGLYLEPRWGWSKFVLIYIISGSSGIAIALVMNSNSVSVAASFSMIGIMGAWFAQLHMTWETLEGWQKKMNLSFCLVVILITICEGIGPSFIDSAGHIGGLLMGLALGYLHYGWQNASTREDNLLSRLILFAGVIFILLYYFVMLGLFFTIINVAPLPLVPDTEITNNSFNSTSIEISSLNFTTSSFESSETTVSYPSQ